MSLADTALANPAVKVIVDEYLHGPLSYSNACAGIVLLGYTELEAGLIMAEAIIRAHS